MKFVIKRNGDIQDFDANKIIKAVESSFNDVENMISKEATETAKSISNIISLISDTLTVEQIQDKVENLLMESKHFDAARAYIQWRFKRHVIRRENTTDQELMSLLYGKSEYWNDENANKNAKVVHTQRDYMAGITSTDITRRLLLTPEIVEAHDSGIIHFHDADYFAQNVINNCCLINLNDMLQNGTNINGVHIDKPHRLITATTIATQIITAVSSSQYGGCTISLAHLAPFVKSSKDFYINKFNTIVNENRNLNNLKIDSDEHLNEILNKSNNELINKLVNDSLRKEITDSVQTFNYQVNSMTTTNGQAPFLSVCMYLNEVEDEEIKNYLALLIEEFLKQRIKGFKNENNVYVTPAFPKLLYFLQEDNIKPGSKYWYITELAAKCTAKRMVPDYISEKMMKKLKGDVYPCMGCVDADELITYKFRKSLFVESFESCWNRITSTHPPIYQNSINENMYVDFGENNDEMMIYDTFKGFVKVKKLIRNVSNEWIKIDLACGRSLTCTPDHPFHTNNGRKEAKDLLIESDEVIVNTSQYSEETELAINSNEAWTFGFTLNKRKQKDEERDDSVAQDSTQSVSSSSSTQSVSSSSSVSTSLNQSSFSQSTPPSQSTPSNSIHSLSTFASKPIPSQVFRWKTPSKFAFLAGIIDSVGELVDEHFLLHSTHKNVILQYLALIQTLHMRTRTYQTKIDSTDSSASSNSNNTPTLIYNIEFMPSYRLLHYTKLHSSNNNLHLGEPTFSALHYTIPSPIIHKTSLAYSAFSYDVETESDHFEVSTIYSHNCRSFLTPDRTKENYAHALDWLQFQNHKYYGRFNQGVITINLIDVALSSQHSISLFWNTLDERLELCHKALKLRHERLSHGVSDMAPIMWQHGALARLKPGESINELLHHGYSTISLGYAGLYEMVKVMTDESITTQKGKEFGLSVMKHMNEMCNKWKQEEDIDYSLYGTPIESTTYKVAKCLKKRFGDDVFIKIDGHDRNYITNSYHIPVFEQIDPFTKLSIESEFQALSPGGAISYIECADLTKNIESVLQVIQFIYSNIMYAEMNIKSDYCYNCGFEGEIEIVDKDNRLEWKCPECGNMEKSKLLINRRVCGYLGTNFFNQGRTNEIKDRYVHLDNHEYDE